MSPVTFRYLRDLYDVKHFVFCRAVWAVANGDYVEARAAQAVVVQYPFDSLSLSCLFSFCLMSSYFKSIMCKLLNNVSHTDANAFLHVCGCECKKKNQ